MKACVTGVAQLAKRAQATPQALPRGRAVAIEQGELWVNCSRS